MSGYVLRAELGAFPLWTDEGENVAPDSLPLSDRLLVALDDWSAFHGDVGGEMSDSDVVEAFVGQGFKLAYALRLELKGRSVRFHHPVTDELVPIERRTPR